MAALPIADRDPTLEAADKALEEAEFSRPRRGYLGMSAVGHQCERNLWYGFRWVKKIKHNAEALKRFADGHHGEDVQAERLRMVDGVTLITVDPDTGKQFEFNDCDGHLSGHFDGAILGLMQAPKTWHVWEHKQVGEKKHNKLAALKAKLGEKNALKAWDEVYYTQAVLYMHYSGMTRHYLTCATPGGRTTISVRTDTDEAEALRIIAKSQRIVSANVPPERISNDPSWFICKWCDFGSVCHVGEFAERNCRTCLHSAPVENAEWLCNFHQTTLTRDEQRQGCPHHRYIPQLVNGEQIDVSGETVIYKMRNGEAWRDEGPYNDA